VAPGTKITVTNHDSATHTVTETGNKAFDTGDIGNGQTATFTAPTTPGTYNYICSIHTYMKGTLVVK
jgi:plastocyanin